MTRNRRVPSLIENPTTTEADTRTITLDKPVRDDKHKLLGTHLHLRGEGIKKNVRGRVFEK